MERLNIQLASKTVELSEYKTYYEVKNRVCYYDYPNGNGVILPYDENSLEKAMTLVDMPVQAKYTINADGQPDLLDHCVSVDSEGNYVFSTESVGVHTSVEIHDDTVETFDGKTMTLPCLFATAKIWRRYPNYCAAIKRLYDENALNNSWEISSFSYAYENGLKTLGDYVFEGNAYLGSNVQAAYGEASKILELSQQQDTELLVASALSSDLMNTSSVPGKEENMENENIIVEGAAVEEPVVEVTPVEEPVVSAAPAEEPVVEEPVVSTEEPVEDTETVEEPVVPTEEPVEEPVPETSALTVDDIYHKLREKCRAKLDCWCYIAFWFPEEKTVWVKSDNDATELDYSLFTYVVVDDEVQVSEPAPVKLTISVASINDELAAKNDGLVAANAKIQELSSQIEALSEFKEKYEAAQKEAIKQKMLSDAEISNCFTAEELESDEMQELFSSCDEAKLKMMIADRLLSNLRSEAPAVDVASVGAPTNVKSSLDCIEPEVDLVGQVRKFLF